MKGELYEYKGQMLSQAEIARLEGINRSTLADWYKKTNNMEEAVIGAKKSHEQRNIKYGNQVMSLKAIAEKEDLKFESLKKFYDSTKDIVKAVELAKEAKLQRKGSIPYKGKMMTITAIANMEGLNHHALGKYYSETNDIIKAIKIAKEAQAKQNGIIPYKGQMMTISGIAALENIKKETLKEYYELYGNIEKAVFITKQSQLKRKKAILKGKNVTYQELSNYYGISTIEIEKIIAQGLPTEEIEKKAKRGIKKTEIIKYDDNSLYNYCLEHSYNYWVIIYLINSYGKTPEEAIQAYVENGQQIPTKWIYEKYNILFKHLALNFGLDSNRIIKIMKDNNCDIEKAIEELIFVSNNQNSDLKKTEIDWLKELYPFLKNLSPEEFEQTKETFFITERELSFLNSKDSIIQRIKRQLLLFDFSTIIEEWPIDELKEMLSLYGITDDEIKTIVCDLYTPFENGIINPNEDYQNRQNYISSIIDDENISNEEIDKIPNLTIREKLTIKIKRNLLKQLLGESPNEQKKM